MRVQRNQKENGKVETEIVFSSLKEKLFWSLHNALTYFNIKNPTDCMVKSKKKDDYAFIQFSIKGKPLKTKVFLDRDNLKFKYLTIVNGVEIYSSELHDVYDIQLKYSKQ